MHVYTTMVSITYCTTYIITNNQVAIQDIKISNLDVKDINPDAHIRVFKKAIKANGEIVKVDIINLFSLVFKDNISKRGENFVQNHPNCTFEELE
jgi:hypothetical protein